MRVLLVAGVMAACVSRPHLTGAVSDEAPKLSSPKNDWWSLQPLSRPSIPTQAPGAPSYSNPIDSFIEQKRAEKGLKESRPADRQTLIRRLYFDLVGLPPTPERIEEFKADKDPLALEKLVDQLLDSPHYGERWARHWLDVVHYGETHGYDKDQPRPNAWPYRDYVIRALNEDRPYSRFVKEQVAGDVLYPGSRDGIEALGFVSAGPWDLIGHAEVPETKLDGRIARHLDRDDMVANTMQTFNSLTVQCAQCHNHKFDPISQEDYYSLQAVFAAVDRADKRYDKDPVVGQTRKRIVSRQSAIADRKKELQASIVARAGAPFDELDKKIGALEKSIRKGDAFGYHSAIEKRPDAVKWVQVDLGRGVTLSNIVLRACKDDFNGIGEGFGFPARFKVEISLESEFKEGVLVSDQSREDVSNPKLKPWIINTGGQAARHIRVTATKLAPRQDDYIFALAELAAYDSSGKNAALGAAVSALDSTEAPVRWQKANLTDGWYPGVVLLDSPELAPLRAERDALLAKATMESEREAVAQADRDLAAISEEIQKLPAPSVAYVATVHTGGGAFVGTGAKGGKPRPIHVLNRGSLDKPGREAVPGTLSCMEGLSSRFELPANHAEGERRAALAAWLADARNPLTWRSIVNRVWQYHFGRGLVETPNDFGKMGERPTHPELLDWLAVEFRDGGQSLKSLHRLIVTSATYRQSSQGVEAYAKIDSDNRYLWRMNRRKLEAESVRDSVLFVSGRLDLKMGGPSFKDFVVEKPEHSPHYEYHLHDPEDPKSLRRSVYRFIVRSQQQPFMTTLDCADPSMQVGRRNESVSALQALTLLNNSLMLSASRHFAAKIEARTGGTKEKVRRAFHEALGRLPAPEHEVELAAYAAEFGLTNFCRLLFNLNEFSFVD